ncbi:hypothetical protein HK098_002405 [Nowakowskiella sp. JEL0407]|nr:hypothetical protein HK098_002405 [Nowakowskiella sp. JEL0407]
MDQSSDISIQTSFLNNILDQLAIESQKIIGLVQSITKNAGEDTSQTSSPLQQSEMRQNLLANWAAVKVLCMTLEKTLRTSKSDAYTESQTSLYINEMSQIIEQIAAGVGDTKSHELNVPFFVLKLLSAIKISVKNHFENLSGSTKIITSAAEQQNFRPVISTQLNNSDLKEPNLPDFKRNTLSARRIEAELEVDYVETKLEIEKALNKEPQQPATLPEQKSPDTASPSHVTNIRSENTSPTAKGFGTPVGKATGFSVAQAAKLFDQKSAEIAASSKFIKPSPTKIRESPTKNESRTSPIRSTDPTPTSATTATTYSSEKSEATIAASPFSVLGAMNTPANSISSATVTDHIQTPVLSEIQKTLNNDTDELKIIEELTEEVADSIEDVESDSNDVKVNDSTAKNKSKTAEISTSTENTKEKIDNLQMEILEMLQDDTAESVEKTTELVTQKPPELAVQNILSKPVSMDDLRMALESIQTEDDVNVDKQPFEVMDAESSRQSTTLNLIIPKNIDLHASLTAAASFPELNVPKSQQQSLNSRHADDVEGSPDSLFSNGSRFTNESRKSYIKESNHITHSITENSHLSELREFNQNISKKPSFFSSENLSHTNRGIVDDLENWQSRNKEYNISQNGSRNVSLVGPNFTNSVLTALSTAGIPVPTKEEFSDKQKLSVDVRKSLLNTTREPDGLKEILSAPIREHEVNSQKNRNIHAGPASAGVTSATKSTPYQDFFNGNRTARSKSIGNPPSDHPLTQMNLPVSTVYGTPESHIEIPPPPPQLATQITLVPLNSSFETITFSLTEVYRLGRNNTQNYPAFHTFSSRVVSKNHCEMYEREGRVYVKDIGSHSGTFLNDSRLSSSGKASEEFKILPGDCLQLGRDFIELKKSEENENAMVEVKYPCVKMQIVFIPRKKPPRESSTNPETQQKIDSYLKKLEDTGTSHQLNDPSAIKKSHSDLQKSIDPYTQELEQKRIIEKQIAEQHEKLDRELSLLQDAPVIHKERTLIPIIPPPIQNIMSSVPPVRTRFVVLLMGSQSKLKKIQVASQFGTEVMNVNLKQWDSKKKVNIQDLGTPISGVQDIEIKRLDPDFANLKKSNNSLSDIPDEEYTVTVNSCPVGTLGYMNNNKLQVSVLPQQGVVLTPAQIAQGSPSFTLTGDFKENKYIIIMKFPHSREQRFFGEATGRNLVRRNVRESKWIYNVELESGEYLQLLLTSVIFVALNATL